MNVLNKYHKNYFGKIVTIVCKTLTIAYEFDGMDGLRREKTPRNLSIKISTPKIYKWRRSKSFNQMKIKQVVGFL